MTMILREGCSTRCTSHLKKAKAISFMVFFSLYIFFFTVVPYVYRLGLLLPGYAQFTFAYSFVLVTTAVTLWCRITLLIHFPFPKVHSNMTVLYICISDESFSLVRIVIVPVTLSEMG